MCRVNERLYLNERIKKRNEIKSFFGNKSKTIFLSSKDHIYSVIVKPNDFGYSRFAVSVKKSRGNAPVRNRAKRQVRDVFRKNRSSIPVGYDYFIIVNNIQNLSFDKRVEYLLSTLLRASP